MHPQSSLNVSADRKSGRQGSVCRGNQRALRAAHLSHFTCKLCVCLCECDVMMRDNRGNPKCLLTVLIVFLTSPSSFPAFPPLSLFCSRCPSSHLFFLCFLSFSLCALLSCSTFSTPPHVSSRSIHPFFYLPFASTTHSSHPDFYLLFNSPFSSLLFSFPFQSFWMDG